MILFVVLLAPADDATDTDRDRGKMMTASLNVIKYLLFLFNVLFVVSDGELRLWRSCVAGSRVKGGGVLTVTRVREEKGLPILCSQLPYIPYGGSRTLGVESSRGVFRAGPRAAVTGLGTNFWPRGAKRSWGLDTLRSWPSTMTCK